MNQMTVPSLWHTSPAGEGAFREDLTKPNGEALTPWVAASVSILFVVTAPCLVRVWLLLKGCGMGRGTSRGTATLRRLLGEGSYLAGKGRSPAYKVVRLQTPSLLTDRGSERQDRYLRRTVYVFRLDIRLLRRRALFWWFSRLTVGRFHSCKGSNSNLASWP